MNDFLDHRILELLCLLIRRLRVVEDGVDKFDFLPRDFIEGILNEKLGEGVIIFAVNLNQFSF